jgi:hypothetical protein
MTAPSKSTQSHSPRSRLNHNQYCFFSQSHTAIERTILSMYFRGKKTERSRSPHYYFLWLRLQPEEACRVSTPVEQKYREVNHSEPINVLYVVPVIDTKHDVCGTLVYYYYYDLLALRTSSFTLCEPTAIAPSPARQ